MRTTKQMLPERRALSLIELSRDPLLEPAARMQCLALHLPRSLNFRSDADPLRTLAHFEMLG
jgi:hypothetical protein